MASVPRRNPTTPHQQPSESVLIMATTPQTATTTAPTEPRWITLDEAERLEKKYSRDRRFVPKKDEETAKKFYFKVSSIIPYTPASYADDPEKHRYQLLISKFYRGKTEKVTVNDGNGGQVEMERDEKVQPFVVVNGKPVVNDKDADRLIDSEQFEKEYTVDTAE